MQAYSLSCSANCVLNKKNYLSKLLCLLIVFTVCERSTAQVNADTMLSKKDSLRIDTLQIVTQDTLLNKPIDSNASLQPDTNKIFHATTGNKKAAYIVEGLVKDYTTAEALSFATVFFPGTDVGKRADMDGRFRFELDAIPVDSISVTMIGYAKKTIPIQQLLKYQALSIELERGSIQIKDIVFHYDRDPALTLVKKVIKNKAVNNYDKADNYSYEVYNKLEMDINKIPKKAFKQSPILKKFRFVQGFIDSTSEEKPFLPLFLTETISDYYYQKKPKKSKEFIKGSRISGYKNQSVSQMLGSMYQNINFYDNSIPIFNVGFVSPIANDAPAFYHYQLTDTQWVNNKLCYQVVFEPKRSGEHTFNGDFWVHDSDFAIQKMNMIVTKEQNINWVNKVTLAQEFTCFKDTIWFLTRDKFFVDFLPPHGDKIAGFLGRKTTTYRNIIVNSPETEAIIEGKKHRADTELDPDAQNRDETYWNTVRHDTLSKNEKAIYKMIDTIQSLPVYKRYYNGIYFLATGIKEVGPLEIGPLYNLYSKNSVEGPRFRFTLGTTPKLFKDIYLNAYIAYGTLDKKWKYDGSMLWLLKRSPRRFIYAEIKHDIDNNVSSYDDAGSLDNIFSTIGRKPNVPWKLAFVDKKRLEYFNSWFNGFSYMLSYEQKSFTPCAPLPAYGIFYNNEGFPTKTVTTAEIGLECKWAYKEQFVEGNYYRTSLGTKYPTLKLYVGVGIKNIFSSNYNYTKLRFTVSDNIKIKRAGSVYYNLFAGKIFGTLPYPILEVHPGNEFYYYDPHAFSMMYRYEYISDIYGGAIIEHSLGSLFFKYIPYLKKMKLRTFYNIKGVYGNLSASNQLLNFDKGYDFQSLARSPYLEAGTGIENILKVLRVDFVWRLLPYRQPTNDAYFRRFGIFGSLKFAF